MYESSKAMKRRYNDGAFHQRFFRGAGIDVGAGNDGISQYMKAFSGITSVRDWDRGDGDAQKLSDIEPNTFDWLSSSHCLEHLDNPYIALRRWIEVVKPGGHVVIVVPDETMYEADTWPSSYGEGHQWSFTMDPKPKGALPKSIFLPDLIVDEGYSMLVRLNYVEDFYTPDMVGDQTRMPNVECAIEFVLRKLPT